jgi:hypothetical protein
VVLEKKMEKEVLVLLHMIILLSSLGHGLNLAILEYTDTYYKRRQMLFRQLYIFNGYKCRKKVAVHSKRRRRFWVRPGRTTAWWNNFVGDVVVEEEWKENFRMCKSNFYKLCGELQNFIQREETVMRLPIDVERQVAMTLYYLSDEG